LRKKNEREGSDLGKLRRRRGGSVRNRSGHATKKRAVTWPKRDGKEDREVERNWSTREGEGRDSSRREKGGEKNFCLGGGRVKVREGGRITRAQGANEIPREKKRILSDWKSPMRIAEKKKSAT